MLAGKKPSDPPAETLPYTDWAVLHWSYTVLETVKILRNLKAPAPYGWTHAVRATCTQHLKRLDAYKQAATEAVSADVPFASSDVIAKIKDSLALALKKLCDEK